MLLLTVSTSCLVSCVHLPQLRSARSLLAVCVLLAISSVAVARISPRLEAPLCTTSFYHAPLAANVQLDAWGPDSIRIRVSPSVIQQIPDVQGLLPYPPGLTPPPGATLPCEAAADSLSNGNLQVSLGDDGSLKATRLSDGAVLMSTTGVSFSPVSFDSIYKSNYSLYATSLSYTHLEGQIYGLGEHKLPRTQYVDFTHLFENSQLYGDSFGGDITIPWYISTAGFGLLYNEAGYGWLHINSQGAQWQSNATAQLDLWVTTSMAGSTAPTPYPQLSSNYAEATGHPNPLPHFASGFWQSKDRYRNQSEVLDITSHFAELQVPVEVFVIDWQHWQYLGDWTFYSRQCWPDPTAMVEQISSYGMHTMISAWPRVDTKSIHYPDMSARKYLTVDAQGKELISADGVSIVYDAFKPEAREYFWHALLSGYVQHGIQLFWLDAAEPEQSLPGQQWWNGKSDREVGMAWTVYHARSIFEGSIASGIPESEVIMLARHGWIGSVLFNAFVWSGDTDSSWPSFNVQVRLAPNVALSGLHWWATDIGGYNSGQYMSADFNELLVRWFQWGAFLPVFRVHGHRQPSEDNGPCGGGGGPNELWTYQHQNEIAAMIAIRQVIRPYVEAQLMVASETGVPIVQPMWYNFSDAECLTEAAEDQYMFGPTFLVAPVLKPMSEGTTRSVYLPQLPQGELWVNYFSGATSKGGERIDVNVTLGTFPLYQRQSREEYRLNHEAEVRKVMVDALRQ